MNWEYKFVKGIFDTHDEAIAMIEEYTDAGWEIIGYDVQTTTDRLVWFRFLLKRRA